MTYEYSPLASVKAFQDQLLKFLSQVSSKFKKIVYYLQLVHQHRPKGTLTKGISQIAR